MKDGKAVNGTKWNEIRHNCGNLQLEIPKFRADQSKRQEQPATIRARTVPLISVKLLSHLLDLNLNKMAYKRVYNAECKAIAGVTNMSRFKVTRAHELHSYRKAQHRNSR